MSVSFHDIPEDQIPEKTHLPAPGTPISPDDAKRLAASIALKGCGNVAPNPLVGAVIVDDTHRFVSAGCHLKLGDDHAEVSAVKAARASDPQVDFSKATLYVTLEPCAHQGRTPPCAELIAKEKFSRVVFGTKDPNPDVSGHGAEKLKKVGIACEQDLSWTRSCDRLAEFFLWNTQNKTPFVGLKAAISLDGAIARRGDKRSWITGKRARTFGHYLRVKYDAVAVGAWTLLHDNPILNPRDSMFPGRQPWRIVLDPVGRGLAASADQKVNLLDPSSEKVVWIINERSKESIAPTLKNFPHITFVSLDPGPSGFIEPRDILTELAKLGITSLLLEGGSGLYRPFIATGSVNRFHMFQAAKFLGGMNKINFYEGEIPALEEQAKDVDITPLEDDWLTEFSVKRLK